MAKERRFETEKHVLVFEQLEENDGKDFIVTLTEKDPLGGVLGSSGSVLLYRGDWNGASTIFLKQQEIIDFVSIERDVKARAGNQPAQAGRIMTPR